MSNQKLSIKNTYHDVLYWATSPISKGTKYHLTQREETILRKLIHYDSSNKFISYSNNVISIHTYVSEVHLKKIIPSLFKKEYINVSLNKVSKNGQIITYRTITINWNTIQQAFDNLPIIQSKEITPENVELEIIDVTLEPTPIVSELDNEVLTEQEETEQTQLTESKDYINLDEFINDNKRKAFEKYFQSELFRQNGITDFEKLKSKNLTEDNLKTLLGFNNDVYYLLNFNEHKELLYENLNNLSFSCLVNGSVGKLTHYNSDTETTDTIRISEKKIDKYLDENEIEFKDLKYKDFIRLKNVSIKLSETF